VTRVGHQARRFVNQPAQERGSRREERDTIDAIQLQKYDTQPNMMTKTLMTKRLLTKRLMTKRLMIALKKTCSYIELPEVMCQFLFLSMMVPMY